MNIYSSNETNFERNGLGFLSQCIKAYVTESLNGDYTLEIEYPLNGKNSEYLVEENIIKCNVGNNNFQLFRINKIIKDYEKITVYALHIFYDLLNNFVVDTAPTNQSCATFGQWVLDRTEINNNFTFYSDITNVKSARYVRKNPVEIILGTDDNSMVNLFGGEIKRDNFDVHFNSRVGADNHVKLIFGKNIESIKLTIDISSMFTRIMPIGYDGLILPEKFVDSPLINNYLTPKITKVEFSNIQYDPTGETEGAYTTQEDAYQALRDAVNELYNNGTDKPSITLKINWLELSKTEQYKNQYMALETVHLGDTITANILDLDYTTRVTKTKYNVLNDMVETFEIGTVTQSIANTLNAQAMAINEISPSSIVEQAKNGVSGLITSAMGGYVYKTREELYIMDTDDITTAQNVWRWNINGLGFSSTGVNGEYSVAMTNDGQIVADMITTGKINTTLIEGYESITQKVTNAVSNDDFDEYKKNVSTTFQQQADAFNFQFNGIKKDINDVDTKVDDNYSELNSYITFKNGNIFLGSKDSNIIAVLTSNGLYFCPSGTDSNFKDKAIAYFSDDTLYITNSISLNSVRIGNYQFSPRKNGSLSFGKVGD